MKRIICKKTYDTESARLVSKRTYGNYGDTFGYEERLYLTDDGFYFIYTNGGEDSVYKCEGIKRVSKQKAEKWLKDN